MGHVVVADRRRGRHLRAASDDAARHLAGQRRPDADGVSRVAVPRSAPPDSRPTANGSRTCSTTRAATRSTSGRRQAAARRRCRPREASSRSGPPAGVDCSIEMATTSWRRPLRLCRHSALAGRSGSSRPRVPTRSRGGLREPELRRQSRRTAVYHGASAVDLVQHRRRVELVSGLKNTHRGALRQ